MKMGHGAKWFPKFVEFIEAGGCAYHKNAVMANIRINNLADLDVMAGTARVNFYFVRQECPSFAHLLSCVAQIDNWCKTQLAHLLGICSCPLSKQMHAASSSSWPFGLPHFASFLTFMILLRLSTFFLQDLAYWVPVFDELHYSDPETIGEFALYEPILDFPKMVSTTWNKREVEFSKHSGTRRHEIQLGQNFETGEKKQADDDEQLRMRQFESFKQLGIEMYSAVQEWRRKDTVDDHLGAGGLRSSISTGSPNLASIAPEQSALRAVVLPPTVGGAPPGHPVTDDCAGQEGLKSQAGIVVETTTCEGAEEKGGASEALPCKKVSQGQAAEEMADTHNKGVELKTPTKAWQRVREEVNKNDTDGREGKS